MNTMNTNKYESSLLFDKIKADVRFHILRRLFRSQPQVYRVWQCTNCGYLMAWYRHQVPAPRTARDYPAVCDECGGGPRAPRYVGEIRSVGKPKEVAQ